MGDTLFKRDEDYFIKAGAIDTAREIAHQPFVWRKMADVLAARQGEISEFMGRVLSVHGLSVIFTGAGSSAFIGESMQMLLSAETGLRMEALHTTDIVATPDCTLRDVPTLMVSYSRSGESPESVGALEYAASRIKKLFNLVIVCKEDSNVANYASKTSDTLVLTMPPETCDLGFAMTSSVSSMALGTWCAFGGRDMSGRISGIGSLASSLESEMDSLADMAGNAAGWEFDRAAYLGSGELRGLGREAAVKMLELTSGYVNAAWNSPMGFRHGPKSMVNDRAVTVHFMSERADTRRYDDDLLREMIMQKKGNRIITVRSSKSGGQSGVDLDVVYETPKDVNPLMASYIKGLVFAQLMAFEKSIALGRNTDNPCESGEVNRVVRGVEIYPIAR
ncbi:MAG: SIS domain-containing protein [Synergistaceae bacterium]|jgi:tagatose-6-phosphate ketose/aldose isomerase|nr:SIS domain-containing protein [Synergistaceae bacterium]